MPQVGCYIIGDLQDMLWT